MNSYLNKLLANPDLKLKVLVISGDEVGDRKKIKSILPKSECLFVSDANMAKEALIRKAEENAPYSLIIDLGTPVNNRQVNTFLILFPYLSENGSYIIENIYGSYWPEFGGKIYTQNTTIEAMKTMVDRLNWYAYRDEKAREAKVNNQEVDFFERNISSIHFYENLIIIEKELGRQPEIYRNGIVENYK